MILRYSVESKHKPAFTAKKTCKSENNAKSKINQLKSINQKEGYLKYSNFRLYNDSNELIFIY